MQKRHFEIIAEIISKLPYAVRMGVSWHFLHYLKDTNPRFKHKVFLKACGVLEWGGPLL